MKLDVKKLSREELENLLVALTFDESFTWYKMDRPNFNYSYQSEEEPIKSTHVWNFEKTLEVGKELTKILEYMDQWSLTEQNFYCKTIAEAIGASINHTAYLLRLLVAKGVIKRYTRDKIITVPTYEIKWVNGTYRRLDGTKEIVAKRAYYRLAEED